MILHEEGGTVLVCTKARHARVIHESCAPLTEVNAHTEALIMLSSHIGDCADVKMELSNIYQTQMNRGYLSDTAYNRRCELANRLWKRTRAQFTNDEDYQLIRSAF